MSLNLLIAALGSPPALINVTYCVYIPNISSVLRDLHNQVNALCDCPMSINDLLASWGLSEKNWLKIVIFKMFI
jgi:hypothetical protein